MKKLQRVLSFVLAFCLCVAILSIIPLSTHAISYSGSQSYMSGKYYRQLCSVTLTGNGAVDIVNVAKSQIGYQSGSSNNDLSGTTTSTSNVKCSEYGRVIGSNPNDWCAYFVSWCARQAGIATSILPNFSQCTPAFNRDLPCKTYRRGEYIPKAGDLIFFGLTSDDITHVGIVTGATNTMVYYVDGNNTSTIPHCVNDSSCSLTYYKIWGYAVPNYDEGTPVVSSISPSSPYAIVGDDVTFSFPATNASQYEFVMTNITTGVRVMYTMLDVSRFTFNFTSPGLYLIEANAYGKGIVGFDPIYFEVHSGNRPCTYINSQKGEVYFTPQQATISHAGEIQERLQEAILCIYKNGILYYEGSMMSNGLYTCTFEEGTYEANVLLTYKSGYGLYSQTIRWHVGNTPSNVTLTQSVNECVIESNVTFTVIANNATSYYLGIGNGTEVVYEITSDKNTFTYTFTQTGLYYIWGNATNSFGTTITSPDHLKVYVEETKHTIGYDANFGIDAPNAQEKTHGVALNLSSIIPARNGYIFKGWSTNPNADIAEYQPGDVFTIDADTILYAVWEKEPVIDFEIKSVSYELSSDKVIFTVTTTPDFNRIKVTTADDLSSYIAYTNNYVVNADGDYVFTLSVPAIEGTTEYAFDGRKVDTNKYSKNYAYQTVECAETEVFKSVSYEIKDDKIIFTVVTAAGDYNRIKVANANAVGTSLGVGTYTVDANGNYVWTVKANAPTETTTFAFDLRTTANKYLKDFYMVEVEYVDTEIYKSVSYAIEGDKIVFTVVTLAGDFNRIKVANANAVGTSLGVGNYTVDANGNYVWTVKANAPSETTTYAFDLRTTANKYLKEYHEFKVEVVETVEIFKSTSYEIVDGKVIFTVVTAAGDYNRVKIALLDNITSYVKYVDTYTVNADGDYVWTLKFNAPTAVTEYALDIRLASTNKYVKDYYYVSVDPIVEPETVYVSANGEIKDGKLVFTIVTKPTTINRIKVMLTTNQSTYVKLIDKYTVDANGNYVWTANITAPSETTSYTLDVRSSVTNKYIKDYCTFDVAVVEEVELYKSVSHEIVDGKIIFTVVTAAGDYNRMKVTTSNNLGGSLGVANSYTIDANGNYVWTIKATAPTESTTYAFDLRDATTSKYIKDYFNYDVTI